MANIKVNVVGAGRVGQTFLRLLRDSPRFLIQDVVSSRFSSAQSAVRSAGTGRAVEEYVDLKPADLWVLTVPDSQISIAAGKIANVFARSETEEPAPVAFHCSGFFPADQMAPLQKLGCQHL